MKIVEWSKTHSKYFQSESVTWHIQQWGDKAYEKINFLCSIWFFLPHQGVKRCKKNTEKRQFSKMIIASVKFSHCPPRQTTGMNKVFRDSPSYAMKVSSRLGQQTRSTACVIPINDPTMSSWCQRVREFIGSQGCGSIVAAAADGLRVMVAAKRWETRPNV